jgi:hypothetical protein
MTMGIHETTTTPSIGDHAKPIVEKAGAKFVHPGERVYVGGKITERGVYRSIPIDTYHRDTELFDGFSISSSGLRQVLDRPSLYWGFSPYNPQPFEQEDKKPLEFGKAAHMLVLGEEGFASRYVLRPAKAPGDPEGRAWNANNNFCKAWLKEQDKAGRIVITDTEIQHIRFMRDSLQRHDAIKAQILNGRIERSIFNKHGSIWLKSRPDVFPVDSGDFVDLKTAASVDDDSLSKAIFNHGYHVQAGLLRMIVREVLGADAFTSFTFVFVEKLPPYDVRVKELKGEDIDLGEMQARRAIATVEQCLKRGEWPGYDGFDGDMVRYIEMPGWAKTRLKIELERAA